MKKIVVASVLIIALIIAVFIWPTPYRYYTLRGSEVERLTRINRFTGTIERLNNDGWHEYGRPVIPGIVEAPAAQPMPAKPDGWVSVSVPTTPKQNKPDADITDQLFSAPKSSEHEVKP